jgi:3-isopropylmalate/(R)-2-methylmalate dehydratase large subunit
VRVDRVYLQDGNTPTVKRLFEQHGLGPVFDPDRIGVFFDHAVLVPERAMANRLKEAKEFANLHGLQLFPPGSGISHVVALEQGWFAPGSLVVGADSHTCTGGATQCLALGMGASDIAASMVTGTTWLRVPETVWIVVEGTPSPLASAKDVVLYATSRWEQERFLYRSIEWCGDWIAGLSMDSLATLANLAVEMGAKCCFLPPGPESPAGVQEIVADPAKSLRLNIEGLPPFVARPHSPSAAVPLDECDADRFDYVFIGTCANSRAEDLRIVADMLRGHRIHRNITCVISPGSQQVQQQASRAGWLDVFHEAGALVLPPGCGPCVGTQGPIPADGARVFSTANRNFRGRMGNPAADVWLGSPRVAALVARLGRLPSRLDLAAP